ncbi:MAG: hypothetical protein PW734_01700 [Verrucomicrobium sp.]|nr:hypothetical protein [Verrucomicrobium sp.]
MAHIDRSTYEGWGLISRVGAGHSTFVSVETPAGYAKSVAHDMWIAGIRNGHTHSEVSKILQLREEGPDHAKTVVTRLENGYPKPTKSRIRSTESAEAILQALQEAGFKRPPVVQQGPLGAFVEQLQQHFHR